ncbi:hypothetical protein, partial [Sphingobacterium bovisgrunnientis]|uniref:hypothetical protein n=1 Tax=Sphingobacterium bovisgrunnientis TaxID=1874697 RepID=UPI00195F0296
MQQPKPPLLEPQPNRFNHNHHITKTTAAGITTTPQQIQSIEITATLSKITIAKITTTTLPK